MLSVGHGVSRRKQSALQPTQNTSTLVNVMVSVEDAENVLEADELLQDNFINLAKQGFEAYQSSQTPRTLFIGAFKLAANRNRGTDGGSQGSHGGQQGQGQQQQDSNQGEQRQSYNQGQQGGGYGDDDNNYSRPPPPQQHGSNQEYYNQSAGGQQGGRLSAPSGNEVHNRPGAESKFDP